MKHVSSACSSSGLSSGICAKGSRWTREMRRSLSRSIRSSSQSAGAPSGLSSEGRASSGGSIRRQAREAARGRPRGLVVDRGRPRRSLARRPRRREKLDARTGFELGHGGRVLSSPTTSIAVGRDAVWFVGESSARLGHPSCQRLDPRLSGDRKEPQRNNRRADGAVWVASSSLSSLALRPSRTASTTSRSARPRVASRPHSAESGRAPAQPRASRAIPFSGQLI